MAFSRDHARMTSRRWLVLGAALAALFALAVAAHFMHRQPVGKFDFNIPGSTVLFMNNGSSSGNEKVFTIKGQKTTVNIDFNNILAYKGRVTLSDMKAAAEDWRSSQAKLSFSNETKEVAYLPFTCQGSQGYFQRVIRTRVNRPAVEQRNLFFVKSGEPYEVSFQFTHSDLQIDRKMIGNTWNVLLEKLGIPTSVLPIGS